MVDVFSGGREMPEIEVSSTFSASLRERAAMHVVGACEDLAVRFGRDALNLIGFRSCEMSDYVQRDPHDQVSKTTLRTLRNPATSAVTI